MTVCVVAIAENGSIFGASDRMLTAADVQFEPQQTKVGAITTSIVIQFAGDASVQASVILSVLADTKAQIQKDPATWVNVCDVAELYRHYYDKLRFAQVEHRILMPLGLDRETWLTKQKDMEPNLVKNIATELMNYEFPSVEAIVSGIDATGAHIYVVRDGIVSCQDTVSFAAIGVGEWHATSQFMFAGHTRSKPIPETVLLVYSAKKRAEVAPGVGKDTDMFVIGPNLGTYASMPEEILKSFDDIYKKEQKSHAEAASKAKSEVDEYVKSLEPKQTEAQTTEEPVSGTDAPPDPK